MLDYVVGIVPSSTPFVLDELQSRVDYYSLVHLQ